MNRMTALVAAMLIGLLAVASTAWGQSYTFTPVLYPGKNLTTLYGINDSGLVIGTGPGTSKDSQAFVRKPDGTFVPFSGPNGKLVKPTGINSNGDIVGWYSYYNGTNNVSQWFVKTAAGKFNLFTPPSDPGFESSAMVYGINDQGQVVGNTRINTYSQAFVMDTTTGEGTIFCYPLTPAGDCNVGLSGTMAYGINNSGVIAGSYWGDDAVYHGYVRNPNGSIVPFDVNGKAYVYGINNKGEITGFGGNALPFVRSADGNTITTITYPTGVIGPAFPSGINNSDVIVGVSTFQALPKNKYYKTGFIASPPVTLSGTVTAEQCGPNPCATAPLPGVLIDVTSTAAPYQATTASDGTYSVAVAPKNTYTLTPSYTQEIGFAPPSRVLTPTASVAKLDFIACVTQLPTGANLEADFLDSLVRKPMVAANTCDPDALDWAMPNLLIPGETFGLGIGGNVNYNDYGVLNSDPYVYPSAGWDVNIFLTARGVPGGAVSCYDPYTQWRWNVTGPSKVLKQPAPGCQTSMTVQQLGMYNVTARKYTRTSSTAPWTLTKVKIGPTKVMARNFIIAALGDSNASGEGNPPFFFSKCNRSETSYQFKAAYNVQEANQHASVTLLWPACSGARIEHVYDKPYPGTNPEPGGAYPLPPQITQVTDAVRLVGNPGEPKTPRPVDAVILSIGVNNLYFGPLMRYGLAYRENFEELPTLLVPNTSADASPGSMKYELDLTMMAPPLTQLIPPLQDRLDDLYPPLANAVSSPLGSGGLGVPKENVIITQYPNFTHDENGNICDTSLLGGAVPVTVPQWNTTDWSWLGAQANELNSHVANTAITCGWTVAKVDNTSVVGFLLHGYCAGPYSLVPPLLPGFGSEPIPYWGDSWFLGVLAGYSNDNPPGPFHPVNLGHVCTANAVDPLLCNALYGNSTCTGTPLPPK